MKKPPFHITDHAVVRYLERVHGVDIEALRRRIGRNVQMASDHPGATSIKHLGFSYKLGQDKTGKPVVVTVTQTGNRKDRGRKRRRASHGKG